MFQYSLAQRTVPVPVSVPGKRLRRFQFRIRFLGKRSRRFRFPVPVRFLGLTVTLIVENLPNKPHTEPQMFCRPLGAKPSFPDPANSSPIFHQRPHHIIPKKGPSHMWPPNRFVNPVRAQDSGTKKGHKHKEFRQKPHLPEPPLKGPLTPSLRPRLHRPRAKLPEWPRSPHNIQMVGVL